LAHVECHLPAADRRRDAADRLRRSRQGPGAARREQRAGGDLLPVELGADAQALGNFRTSAGVWRVYDGRPGEKALVLADQARTIVVVGRTDVRNLETLASSLA
jgi:hypothetical protein